jgi:hypothetical protein
LILLDTCTLIFDALTPDRVSAAALRAIEDGETNGTLACADISLWEIAMLVNKRRLHPGTDITSFCRLVMPDSAIRHSDGHPFASQQTPERAASSLAPGKWRNRCRVPLTRAVSPRRRRAESDAGQAEPGCP